MPTVLDYLENTAAARPDAIALSDGTETYTFAQLRGLAYGIAAMLAGRKIQHQAVGVYAQRKALVIAAMLGCAASGNAYVPLNPEAPQAKNSAILRHCGIRIVLGFADNEYNGEGEGCEYIRLASDTITPEERPAISVVPADTLYIIYTSGSTGEPKGIRKSHGAVTDFIEAYVKELDFQPTEIIGNQTPFCFDASAKDIYLMMKTGARLEIIPAEKFVFPIKLIEYLNEKKITFISWVPSALAVVARLKTFRDILPQTLRRVCFVGEVFPVKDLQAWREALPDIEYINLYGSSELAGICCLYRIPHDRALPEALPIGQPLSNSVIRLYDGENIVPDQGEMLVESAALADEYVGAPDKTAAAFLTLTVDGQPRRMLRTGDRARYDENGNLIFIARADTQIKYMGYRIELGEIEAAVDALPFIGRSCVLYNADRERITVFCTTTQEGLALRDLKAALREKLPDYMLPRKLIVLDAMPLNANGKTDRTYLKTLL